MKEFFPETFGKLVLGIVLTSAAIAWSQDCKFENPPPKIAGSSLLGKAFSSHCSSLRTVFKRLASNPKFGGRELEKNKPLDRVAALLEIDDAMADPKLKKELDQINASEPDELRRLALEAALFDDNQLYSARDLRIEEISSKL